MASVLNVPYFSDEQAAFDRLEAIIWPEGIVCPHCGTVGRAAALTGVKDKLGRVRIGLKKCYACRKQFTARVGTVFEASHVPLHIWFQAAFLLCSSKKGIKQPPASPHARRHAQNGLVYEPQAARSDGRAENGADGRGRESG